MKVAQQKLYDELRKTLESKMRRTGRPWPDVLNDFLESPQGREWYANYYSLGDADATTGRHIAIKFQPGKNAARLGTGSEPPQRYSELRQAIDFDDVDSAMRAFSDHPEWFDRYRAEVSAPAGASAYRSPRVVAEEDGDYVELARMAAENGEDLDEYASRLFRENPGLYDEYRRSVTLGRDGGRI